MRRTRLMAGAPPADGCTTAGRFLNWTADDAAYMEDQAWHSHGTSHFGGNTQIAAYSPCHADRAMCPFRKKILVTLQPIAGQTQT